MQPPRLPSRWSRDYRCRIRLIIESGTWQLRHASEPDAAPFLNWRTAMGDEGWVNWNAQEDETWYEQVQRDFGLNGRRDLRATSED